MKGKVQSKRKKGFSSKKENKMIFRKIFVVFFGFFAIIITFLYLRYIILAMQHGGESGAITIAFNNHNEMYIEFCIILMIFIFLSIGSIYLFRKF